MTDQQKNYGGDPSPEEILQPVTWKCGECGHEFDGFASLRALLDDAVNLKYLCEACEGSCVVSFIDPHAELKIVNSFSDPDQCH